MLFGEWRSERSEGVKTNDCFLEFRSSGVTGVQTLVCGHFSCSLPLAPYTLPLGGPGWVSLWEGRGGY